jgi:hypothetical protein
MTVLVAWENLGNRPLLLGVAGHERSITVVALNAPRLLRRKPLEMAA